MNQIKIDLKKKQFNDYDGACQNMKLFVYNDHKNLTLVNNRY